jgi:hypothetical protein
MNIKHTLAAMVLLLYLVWGQDAFAHYNPSTGRWLSRDPIDEAAFQHTVSWASKQHEALYRRRASVNEFMFVQNDAIGKIDLFGLMITSDRCCCRGISVGGMVRSGLKVCTGKADTVDTDHGWLEMDDGWSADFVSGDSIWHGPGVVRSPTDYAHHFDKECKDVFLHACAQDRKKFLQAVKDAVAQSQSHPPDYIWFWFNCFSWDSSMISEGYKKASGCTTPN